ncbi:MAG: hypothetical protein BM564_03255 [Bacteroidetes bacterium MedPE-SWsnd-G2]|nr:MAG: hypothetical protein BM564_03255 [Bacteroidetes bacterium MedPE-SWsnd-G2]
MKKLVLLSLSAMLMLSSCVSSKKYEELEATSKKNKDLLNSATVKLNTCLEERASLSARSEVLQDQVTDLRNAAKELSILTTKGATNLEKTLESLQEKDLRITRLQDALTRKDSVNLALVSSFKKEIGMDDPDIQINVEKGVVFISIADKLLFKSGSYNVTSQAKEVLAKVAKVVNGKPDFECMVEGHTDSQSYKKGVLLDNWDLSVKRSTSVVRVLEDLGVQPQRLVAAGRSFYVPLVDNDTAENRARNRRTRIVVLPKIDQFYDMVEKEMKNLSTSSN